MYYWILLVIIDRSRSDIDLPDQLSRSRRLMISPIPVKCEKRDIRKLLKEIKVRSKVEKLKLNARKQTACFTLNTPESARKCQTKLDNKPYFGTVLKCNLVELTSHSYDSWQNEIGKRLKRAMSIDSPYIRRVIKAKKKQKESEEKIRQNQIKQDEERAKKKAKKKAQRKAYEKRKRERKQKSGVKVA